MKLQMFKPRTRQGNPSLGIKLVDSVLSGSRQDDMRYEGDYFEEKDKNNDINIRQ